ncbi:type VI secretion protein [Robbsia andropogonis]|uniref:Type VI secretion protein n=1 Tax=Robbsia andropogonis TaxID=28092 RepID=A0A0F5K3S4_9BURK|nr:type VI secretion system contractile sheath small subunit [Robbsia andropogonis]KKB64580.1 type VI secretion protein [Robbsia andropogonis]
MSNSLQKWVGRNRAPRVQITYDVEVGDAVERRELPMVVGVMSDLAGMPEKPLPKLKDRRLTEIDRDNFNDVMARVAPRLMLSVPDTMKGEGSLALELHFSHMRDFHPDALVNQVPRLKKLLEARQQLRDLLAKLDGNDELDALLESVISNDDALKTLRHDAGAKADAADSVSDVENQSE